MHFPPCMALADQERFASDPGIQYPLFSDNTDSTGNSVWHSIRFVQIRSSRMQNTETFDSKLLAKRSETVFEFTRRNVFYRSAFSSLLSNDFGSFKTNNFGKFSFGKF